MDNQQATNEAWAVLAGLVLGDGSFMMIPYSNHKRSPSGFTAVRPMVTVHNKDAAIIKFVVDLYDQHGIKYYIENKIQGGFRPGSGNIINVLVLRFDSVKFVLEKLVPHLVGDKRARAELLLRYVNKERRGRRQFDPDDETIIREFCKLSPKIKKGKPSRLIEVLRDYEQNGQKSDDIVHSTTNEVG